MDALTYRAATDEPDHEEISLIGATDSGVTVCFNRNTDDTANMTALRFDEVVGSDMWEEVGFIEL